ncbi:MAG TPA: 30S ribosomal protein S8 [Myxococcaceae bacterium]|nr:30S ribosomal protein S8 [Myxococcaceae bacterium]
MPVNDPIGDMLTRLRNASRAHHAQVVMPASRLKVEILKVLKEEGYIGDYTLHERKPQNELTVALKYGPDKSPAITAVRRVSRPGLRRYVRVDDIPDVLGGMGVAILSTSIGVMGDGEARRRRVGGELICTVY